MGVSSPTKPWVLKKLAQVVIIPNSIQEVLSVNLSRNTEYSEVFHDFPQFLHENAEIVFWGDTVSFHILLQLIIHYYSIIWVSDIVIK